MPLIFESFGRWHSDIEGFLKPVCRLISHRVNHSFSVIYDYWIRRISVCLQVGQAKLYTERAALDMVRARAAGRGAQLEIPAAPDPEHNDIDLEFQYSQEARVHGLLVVV